MTDKVASVATQVSGGTVASSASPKKAKSALSKKAWDKPSHPKVADMVNSAIKELKERGGSSFQAIKKYIAVTYKVDTEKLAPFIKRYIKSALAFGVLIQTKGKGVAGSFKLSASAKVLNKDKAKSALSKKLRDKPSHPKVADMVNSAIKELKERGGSSFQAIKKYIAATYKVDMEKQAPFIKTYIKSALAYGVLIQTKGKGIVGSFKLSASAVKAATVKPKAVKRVAKRKIAAKKPPAAKKPAAPKKAASPSKPKKLAPKKPSTATSEKKKTTKGPAAKPPKAKTTKAKPTPKSPRKKVKAAAPRKVKPAAAAPKPKKAAPKKATVAKN